MARPRKIGLDYFPIDCDILSDEKVVAINVHYGAKGVAVFVALLCAIYRNGYFIQWNDTLRLKIANQLDGVSANLVSEIVAICVKYDLFDKVLFNADGDEHILTSKGIQTRYFEATTKRNFEGVKFEYLLISAPETKVSATETRVSSSRNSYKIKENKINKKTLSEREQKKLENFEFSDEEVRAYPDRVHQAISEITAPTNMIWQQFICGWCISDEAPQWVAEFEKSEAISMFKRSQLTLGYESFKHALEDNLKGFIFKKIKQQNAYANNQSRQDRYANRRGADITATKPEDYEGSY